MTCSLRHPMTVTERLVARRGAILRGVLYGFEGLSRWRREPGLRRVECLLRTEVFFPAVNPFLENERTNHLDRGAHQNLARHGLESRSPLRRGESFDGVPAKSQKAVELRVQ